MIVDPEQDTMAKKAPRDSPPSYASAVEDANGHMSSRGRTTPPPLTPEHCGALQPYSTQPYSTPTPTVYNYMNPLTKQYITTALPPDHPEMLCLQAGMHVTETKYGLLGILAAIFWFPLGIGLCIMDRNVKCIRCGAILNEGLCS